MIALSGSVLPHAETGRLSGTWDQLQHVGIQHHCSDFFCLVRDSCAFLFCYCRSLNIAFDTWGAFQKIKPWPGYDVLKGSQPPLRKLQIKAEHRLPFD